MRPKRFRNLLCGVIALLSFMNTGTAQSGPNISNLSLPQGPVGMGLVINGTNFGSAQGGSSVTLNGTALTVVSWGSTSITVRVPAGSTTGNVVVTVSSTASNG